MIVTKRRILVFVFLVLVFFFVASQIAERDKDEPPTSTLPPTSPLPSYSLFKNPTKVSILGYTGDSMEPYLSRDGKYLFFNNSNDPKIDTDLFYAERVDDTTFTFKGEVAGANTHPSKDANPAMDANGNFYFVTNRSFSKDFSLLYTGKFNNGVLTDVALVPETFGRKSPPWVNFDCELSPDGKRFYTVDGKYPKNGGAPVIADLMYATWNGSAFVKASDSDEIFKNLNTDQLEYAISVSADELEVFFTRATDLVRGSVGGKDIELYQAERKSVTEPFGTPRKIDVPKGFVEGPSISPDGKSLYFHRKDGAKFVLYRAVR